MIVLGVGLEILYNLRDGGFGLVSSAHGRTATSDMLWLWLLFRAARGQL